MSLVIQVSEVFPDALPGARACKLAMYRRVNQNLRRERRLLRERLQTLEIQNKLLADVAHHAQRWLEASTAAAERAIEMHGGVNRGKQHG